MGYIVGLSVFLVALGAIATGIMALAYRIRHRNVSRMEPELPLEGGSLNSSRRAA